MNKRIEKKLTDLSGMNRAVNEILQQAWERGRKYGNEEKKDVEERPIKGLAKLDKNGDVKIELLRPQAEWIPISEELPEEKLSGGAFGFDFEEVLCTTIWGNVKSYKFGKPIGHDKPHFWHGGEIMDKYVIAWQPLPEPYKEGDRK